MTRPLGDMAGAAGAAGASGTAGAIGPTGPADPGAPAAASSEPPELRLHRWTDRAVIGVAVAAFAAGFGQFGLVAALGDVARDFGHLTSGGSIADQVGLSGTELGIGLAINRLASLGSLPLLGLADRVGRRSVLLVTLTLGLALTVISAASPGYWWFVAIFACGRPLLSTTNALAQVCAAELTDSVGRASAVALTAAGYGVGAGVVAIVHSLGAGTLGFRGTFALACIPLALVPLLRRWIVEPDRFAKSVTGDHALPVVGPIAPRFRRRLAIVALLAFSLSLITGPATSFVFVYAQNVQHQPGYITASMVVGAGVAGLIGLLAGRWLADRLGRRPTGTLAMVALAAFGTLTYGGSRPELVTGYILGILAGSAFAPAAGSLLTELFPTSVRASVAGWWVAAGVLGAVAGLVEFGAVADVGDRFGVAAAITFLPAALAAGLFWLVPETRGKEPEELWPEQSAASHGLVC